MFIEKIKTGQTGILLYGITPPKAGTDIVQLTSIAERTINRLAPLDIDALVVYDVQDESARTNEARPFPFLNAIDPFAFASSYLRELRLPKIIYRPAGKFSQEELSGWLDELHAAACYPVFVGIPTPGYPVKTTLEQAYRIWSRHKEDSVIGAVAIPERHAELKDEDKRMLDKKNHGVSFFISQCVFDLGFAKQLVEDLDKSCRDSSQGLPTIIFTLTTCGSLKTLQFLEWLGIHIPQKIKEEWLVSASMLDASVAAALAIASSLADLCNQKSIPFGFNIESVAIRREEIEASVEIVNKIAAMLYTKGIRPKKAMQGIARLN